MAPGRGDIPALPPAEAGTWLSDLGGMKGRVDLVGWRYTCPKTVTHPVSNRARSWLTSLMRRTMLTTTPRCQPRTIQSRRLSWPKDGKPTNGQPSHYYPGLTPLLLLLLLLLQLAPLLEKDEEVPSSMWVMLLPLSQTVKHSITWSANSEKCISILYY